MAAYGQAVHREVCSRGGIDYEVTVYAASGGLYGTWFCSACGFNGVSQILSGTQEEALKLAFDALGVHHDSTHGAP